MSAMYFGAGVLITAGVFGAQTEGRWGLAIFVGVAMLIAAAYTERYGTPQ